MAKEKEVIIKIISEVEDSKVKSLEKELEKISSDKHNVDIETGNASSKAKSLKSDVDKVDDEQLSVKLDTTNAMLGLQSLADGFRSCIQGVRDLASNMSAVENKFKQFESNQAFLTLNLGADKANEKLNQIQNTVAKLPGDDTTMTTVLSSAVAMGNDLSQSEMEAAVKTMADYMAGSEKMGKMAKETQQDILKYLLDGNTAELERGSIVSQYVDELKNANTFQERQVAMQKVLKKLGYDGMASMPTLANKQAEWNGMLDQSMAKVGKLWSKAEMGAIDYILKLNESTNGLAGMGIVIAQMVGGPLVQLFTGIGQVGTGLKTIGVNGENLRKLGSHLKNIGSAALNAAKGLFSAVRAQNALNLSMLANPVLLLVAALAILIGYMVYLYSTNEQCRKSVNKLGEDLGRVASGDYSGLRDVGNDLLAASDSFAQASGFAALIGEENYNRWVELRNGMAQTVGEMLTNAGQQIMLFGEQVNAIFQQAILSIQSFGMWIYQTFMQVIMTIQQFGMQLLQLPMYIAQAIMQGVANFQFFVGQVAGILASVIANVASFGGQLISQLGSSASNAASSFLSGISGLASAFMGELSNMLSYAVSWASSLASAMASAASSAVSSFLGNLKIASPGIMQRKFVGEMEGIVTAATDTEAPLGSAMGNVANSAVNNFNIRGLNTPTVATGGTQAVGGVTMNITINGDVDSEERMEKFADYIITRMTWDNTTAGRTV